MFEVKENYIFQSNLLDRYLIIILFLETKTLVKYILGIL